MPRHGIRTAPSTTNATNGGPEDDSSGPPPSCSCRSALRRDPQGVDPDLHRGALLLQHPDRGAAARDLDATRGLVGLEVAVRVAVVEQRVAGLATDVARVTGGGPVQGGQ